MTDKEKLKPVRLIKKTYSATIRNSIGSKIFRNFYIKEEEKEFDAMKDGELSCAFFVSSILKLFNLIKDIHGTVEGTVRDLEESGWQKVKEPKEGSVIVYSKKDFGKNDVHGHIGFYVGKGKAISNSAYKKYPVEHDWQMDNRGVVSIYWSEKIESIDNKR